MVLQPVRRRCAGSCSLEGLAACQPRPKARTTVPAADLAGHPDLIERDFTADAPARKLVGDITYIHTREGFVYLATVMDCYSKRIVGYAMAEHMRTELVQNALEMAVRNCQPIKGVTIFHSDRGSQYTSADYTATMNKYGIHCFGGKNRRVLRQRSSGIIQRHPRRKELVNRKIYHTRRKAIKEVTSWIEH